MTTNLSKPTLYTCDQLKCKPFLAAEFARLANQAFTRSKAKDTEKWIHTNPRFPSIDLFYNMVGDDGIVTLIFDLDQDATPEEEKDTQENGNGQNIADFERKKVVACAGATRWKGGWGKEGAGTEPGWEIKAVCVDGDEKFIRRGLAVQLLTSLESHLIDKARAQLQEDGTTEDRGQLALWILAAECSNGAYWRGKGYREVRRKTEGKGVWSCKTSFEMVVLRKDLVFDVNPIISVASSSSK